MKTIIMQKKMFSVIQDDSVPGEDTDVVLNTKVCCSALDSKSLS